MSRFVWHSPHHISAPAQLILTSWSNLGHPGVTVAGADLPMTSPKRQKMITRSANSEGITQGATFAVPGLSITDHHLSLPLDHAGQCPLAGQMPLAVPGILETGRGGGDGCPLPLTPSPAPLPAGTLPGTIDVFFRVCVHRNKKDDDTLPYLLYLQGGPGYEAPRPTDASGWMKSAVNYFRVVLMVRWQRCGTFST